MSLVTAAYLSQRATLLMKLLNSEYKAKAFEAVTTVDDIKDVVEPYKTWLNDFTKINNNAKYLTPNQEMAKENPPFSKEIMEALQNRKNK